MPVSDAELAGALGVAEVGRRPWPYASSLPMEELHVSDPAPRRLLFKDLSPSRDLPRPAFLADPLREIEAYRAVLAPRGLDVPACHAAVSREDRCWLVLELVDAEPLWQRGDLEAWEAAARWLAALHACPPPTAVPRLLRYDAAHLRRRFELATGIPRASAIGERVAARLARVPASFIHGEFYASNVLVQPDGERVRIRPVDWETAGIGPGVLDLAALTSGWAGEARARIERAYRLACPPGRQPDGTDLDHARLLLAAQWVGWSPAWTPPAEHARDWRAEATELIARLAL
jgi:hypothetical protein